MLGTVRLRAPHRPNHCRHNASTQGLAHLVPHASITADCPTPDIPDGPSGKLSCIRTRIQSR